jgi:ABC-type dipeptide/oligopeptide/nickel transport system permease component
MARIVLIFGLISGAIAAALMWIMLAAMKSGSIDLEHGSMAYVTGYASMIISLSLVFFGVKSYRDNNGGHITFFKGLQVGILIGLISAVCYAASWEVYYRTGGSNFMQEYSQKYVEHMKQNGATDDQIANAQVEMAHMVELYQNFFIRFGMTLMEILPVAIVVTLVSAALLRKREILPALPA